MEINYNEQLDKAIDSNSICPINWLYNQDKLRNAWEFFEDKSKILVRLKV